MHMPGPISALGSPVFMKPFKHGNPGPRDRVHAIVGLAYETTITDCRMDVASTVRVILYRNIPLVT
jgi:hypothetical protein